MVPISDATVHPPIQLPPRVEYVSCDYCKRRRAIMVKYFNPTFIVLSKIERACPACGGVGCTIVGVFGA
jgi:hypothetical protein